jgi:TRAP-type C4-dicarboxylate transport system substrate-binding protein
MSFNRRTFIATATVSLLPIRAALAEDKVVFKSSDVHPEGYPTVVAIQNMGKKLEQATNGRLSIEVYPAMQLGGEKQTLEQAQVGALALTRGQRRRDGADRQRSQRLQPALRVPRHRSHA